MSKHFVIQSRADAESGERKPLGKREDIIESLSHYNTMPETEGEDMLWGPGIRIELPPTEGDVHQMLLHLVEEEIAWYPIVRLARQFNWSVTDIETGRELEP
jgi:hypothetical protein|tara:strand:- start:205 stop:510 length:306 start_codon:yes stop_codon:yes gene_type:complete